MHIHPLALFYSICSGCCFFSATFLAANDRCSNLGFVVCGPWPDARFFSLPVLSKGIQLPGTIWQSFHIQMHALRLVIEPN